MRRFERGGIVRAGVLFVSAGLRYTSASHMAVFLYTAPLFSALGLHFLLPQERLSPVQWLGMLIAFGGVVLAISGMAVENGGAERLKGDLYGLLAGIARGASTTVIRTTRPAECPAKQTLLCQLTGACVLLSLPALATGNLHFTLSPVAGTACCSRPWWCRFSAI